MEFRDYYKVLGVPRAAGAEEIRRAFRKLARQYHPDVAKDKRTAEEKFKEINEAYEVLGDADKRRQYDELGANWKAGAGFQPPPGRHPGRGGGPIRTEDFEFHFGGTGFSDFFEQFFGRGSRAGGFSSFADPAAFAGGAPFAEGDVSERGQDIEGDILVTLHEALHGAVRSVSLKRAHPPSGEAEAHTFKVRIPAGVREGQRIRLTGKGNEGLHGGAAGDLYLRVRLAAHPEFRVRGVDLVHDLELAPWEAVLGATVQVPTLDGPATVKIPPGTANGQQLRVRGRGLLDGQGKTRGDLYVVAQIEVPTRASEHERELWEQLARTSDFRPREG
jgi:curved DNA-binding protein